MARVLACGIDRRPPGFRRVALWPESARKNRLACFKVNRHPWRHRRETTRFAGGQTGGPKRNSAGCVPRVTCLLRATSASRSGTRNYTADSRTPASIAAMFRRQHPRRHETVGRTFRTGRRPCTTTEPCRPSRVPDPASGLGDSRGAVLPSRAARRARRRPRLDPEDPTMSRTGLPHDAVFYPTSDGQPMAETPVHGDCMMYVTSALRWWFEQARARGRLRRHEQFPLLRAGQPSGGGGAGRVRGGGGAGIPSSRHVHAVERAQGAGLRAGGDV